ncbi:TnpV protein [Aeribacillus pallidus]|jgi:metal-dependent amidase/aminoacylase/carboxypeptidase family protein
MNEKPIGKYGSLRRKHLMENNMILYESLSIQGQLHQHLVDINEQANKRMEIMTKKLMEQYGVTEELKAEDQMKWIQEVNNIRAMAEEVILREMIYV